MDELFLRRMANLLDRGSLGAKLVKDSNTIENKLFSTDSNYKRGCIYDWDMNEIEEVEFKFEKKKTYIAGEYEIEYMIHFKPDFNPEDVYRNRYYIKDGKERLGFYIDVWDESKERMDKYLIVGKDQRVAFDRYNAYRCNWYLEWVSDGKYYKSFCHVKNTANAHMKNPVENFLGGTLVTGDMAVLLPTSEQNKTIKLGTRFMICDDYDHPQVYEVIKINDNTPLGVIKIYIKQVLFNEHVDFGGIINESSHDFVFDLPIEDLPVDYGYKYHMICDCIKSRKLAVKEKTGSWTIDCPLQYLYINASPTDIIAIPSEDDIQLDFGWHIVIDNVEYNTSSIKDYFDIVIEDNILSIRCINRDMEGYVVRIEIYNNNRTYYDFIELKVRR